MTWTPFLIGIAVYAAFALSINFGFGHEKYREAVKKAHKYKNAFVVIVILAVLFGPFTLIVLQN